MKRILVTGGAGFIGSAFCRMWQDKYDITVLDSLTYAGRKENLDGVRCKFVRGDVRNKRLVDSLVKKSDAVIHFAAETHVDRSIKKPDDFITTNVNGTHNILEAVKKHNVKTVYISTDEVYGPAINSRFKEDAPLRPSSPYSASKASADLLCQAYYKTYGTPVTIIRPSNNYGPFQNPEKCISRFILLAMHNKPLPLFYPGKQEREWIYVDDCCDAINLVLKKGKAGEIYNIGSGDIRKNMDVAKLILKLVPETKSKIRLIEDRKGHDWRYSIDSSKIRKLGWNPKTNFKCGLAITIVWLWRNPDFWMKKMKDKFVDFGGKK